MPMPLRQGTTVMGRQTDCQVRIPAADVSRHHCQVENVGSVLRVADLGSRNGTLVNGERVDKRELSAGDVLTVGPLVFVVRIAGVPERIDAAASYAKGRAAAVGAEAGVEPGGVTKTVTSMPRPAAAAAMDEADSSSVIDFDFDFDDDESPKL